jgi:transcriptional regulator of arginine metabolism
MRATPKTLRQHRLLELVSREPALTQEDLVRRLAEQGLRVTQATLSRDIRDLGLVKTGAGYRLPDVAPSADGSHLRSLAHLLREFVVDVREAQNLLLLKTSPGSAQPVAAALDAQRWPELLGTLAGDDTVLAVSADAQASQALGRRIRELMT